MPKSKKNSAKKVNPPKKSKDILVTQKMLYKVRDELKSDISSVRAEVKSLEKRMDAKFDKLIGEVHRMAVLMEEQNSRNLYVLDGYAQIYERMNKQDVENVELKKSIKDV